MNTAPKFRVDKEAKPPKVFLQCSRCDKDIREVKMDESIDVRRAYYCKDHDDGSIHLNVEKSEE